jgi:hypothetical protein
MVLFKLIILVQRKASAGYEVDNQIFKSYPEEIAFDGHEYSAKPLGPFAFQDNLPENPASRKFEGQAPLMPELINPSNPPQFRQPFYPEFLPMPHGYPQYKFQNNSFPHYQPKQSAQYMGRSEDLMLHDSPQNYNRQSVFKRIVIQSSSKDPF